MVLQSIHGHIWSKFDHTSHLLRTTLADVSGWHCCSIACCLSPAPAWKRSSHAPDWHFCQSLKLTTFSSHCLLDCEPNDAPQACTTAEWLQTCPAHQVLVSEAPAAPQTSTLASSACCAAFHLPIKSAHLHDGEVRVVRQMLHHKLQHHLWTVVQGGAALRAVGCCCGCHIGSCCLPAAQGDGL